MLARRYSNTAGLMETSTVMSVVESVTAVAVTVSTGVGVVDKGGELFGGCC